MPVAQECRQYFFMSQVLAPRLEFLRRLADGLAQPYECVPEAVRIEVRQIGELRPSRVEPERLHAGRALVVDQLLDHPAVGDVRNVVGRAPFLRVVLAAEVELAGLERLDRDGGVAVAVVSNDVDVVLSSIDREIAAPVVGHPFEGDRTAGFDRRDSVGTASEQGIEDGGLEVAPFPPVLRQDADLPDDQRRRIGFRMAFSWGRLHDARAAPVQW